MRILVISLPGDNSRRHSISETLSGLGLDFEFFDAIDGRKGIPEEYDDFIDEAGLEAHWRNLTKTEIACSLGHAFACQKVAQDLKEPSIILEDDALLSDDFAAMVKSGCLEASKKELVLLYHNNTRVTKWPKKRLFGDYFLRTPLKAPWGAVAYYVSPEGARIIAERSLPIAGVADWGFDILDMDTSCLVPRIVEHPPIDPAQSTMVERNLETAVPVKPQQTLWEKIADRKYRRYFYRKVRSEWIYRPNR